jgi:hypothetical protein
VRLALRDRFRVCANHVTESRLKEKAWASRRRFLAHSPPCANFFAYPGLPCHANTFPGPGPPGGAATDVAGNGFGIV